eukprot:scaffold89757_cov39-Attheya_sp.AAC.1
MGVSQEEHRCTLFGSYAGDCGIGLISRLSLFLIQILHQHFLSHHVHLGGMLSESAFCAETSKYFALKRHRLVQIEDFGQAILSKSTHNAGIDSNNARSATEHATELYDRTNMWRLDDYT